MTQLGADPDHLRDLAGSLRTAAGRLDLLSLGLARRAHSAGWHGPDADRFGRQLHQELRPALRSSSSALFDLAGRVAHEADEQLGVSSVPAEVAGTPAGSATIALPPPEPSPRAEQRLLGALEVRAGPVLGTLHGELTLQDLGRGRRRVVLARTIGAGAALSAGSSAQLGLGGPHGSAATGSGASAEVRGRLGAVERRSWEVDAEQVPELLARVAGAEGSTRATGSPDTLQRLAGTLDGLADRLTGRDPGLDLAATLALSPPAPRRHEVLAEIELQASAGGGLAALAGAGARAHGVGVVRVGRAVTDGSTGARAWTVAEVQASTTAGLTSTLLRRLGISLPADHHDALTVRIEVPDQADPPADDRSGPAPARVRISSTQDQELVEVLAHVRLGAQDRSSIDGALGSLARGDVAGAVERLGTLAPAPDAVAWRSETARLAGHSARAGGTAGIGWGGGVTARGQVLEVDRRG